MNINLDAVRNLLKHDKYSDKIEELENSIEHYIINPSDYTKVKEELKGKCLGCIGSMPGCSHIICEMLPDCGEDGHIFRKSHDKIHVNLIKG